MNDEEESLGKIFVLTDRGAYSEFFDRRWAEEMLDGNFEPELQKSVNNLILAWRGNAFFRA